VALVVALYLGLQGARKDALLQEQETNLRQRQLDENQQREDVRRRFAGLFAQAEKVADGAARDTKVWSEGDRALRSGLGLSQSYPTALEGFALVELARRLLERAERQLADAGQREAARDQLALLRRYHSDAVFFASLFTGLELPESLRRAREAVASGLSLFGVS